jgi:hypothetical protein
MENPMGDQRTEHSKHESRLAASTDIADVMEARDEDNKHAHAASARQRKGSGAQRAASDVHVRITSAEQSGQDLRVELDRGSADGLQSFTRGYVEGEGGGVLADFVVAYADEPGSDPQHARGYVKNCTLAQLGGAKNVVLNPSSKPPPGQNIGGKIIAVMISGSHIHITFDAGAQHNVRPDMKGTICTENGRVYPYEGGEFEVQKVYSRYATAYVKLHQLGILREYTHVLVNGGASKPAGDAVAARPQRHGRS